MTFGREIHCGNSSSEVSIMEDTVDALYHALWHACAGPLVTIPRVGERVFYFPQGHIEQVQASINQISDSHMPVFYLPWKIPCKVINVRLKAEPVVDELFVEVTLFPDEEEENTVKEPLPLPPPRPHVHYFSKNLTAFDTSVCGGLFVPKRHAYKCLPPLDMCQQRPTQDLVAKDLHGEEWFFRHIFRRNPSRHLLQSGWRDFICSKRLVAGDTFIFLRGENGELRVGVRRAMRQQRNVPSSVITSHNMHLANAWRAISTRAMFAVNYKPRTSPFEFIVPFDKYMAAAKNTHSVGMRFKMRFESEKTRERRFTGTIVGIEDFDPNRWLGSKWRCLKVRWDDVASSFPRSERVCPWEIEPVWAPTALNPLPMPWTKRSRANMVSSSFESPVHIREGSIKVAIDPSPVHILRVLQDKKMTTLRSTFADNNELDTAQKPAVWPPALDEDKVELSSSSRLGSENWMPALLPNETTCADFSSFQAPGHEHVIYSSFLDQSHVGASVLKNPLQDREGNINFLSSPSPMSPSSSLPSMRESIQEQQVEEAEDRHSCQPVLPAEEVQPDPQEVESQREASPVPLSSAAQEFETVTLAVIDRAPPAIVTQETTQVVSAVPPQPALASASLLRAEYRVDSKITDVFISGVRRFATILLHQLFRAPADFPEMRTRLRKTREAFDSFGVDASIYQDLLLDYIVKFEALDRAERKVDACFLEQEIKNQNTARAIMTEEIAAQFLILGRISNAEAHRAKLERESADLEASLAFVREQHAKVVAEVEQLMAEEL